MSAGICFACIGAAPVFTGDLGQRPEDRVVAVHVIDVHGNGRHLTFCHACTAAIVGTWARTARKALPPKTRTRPAPEPGLASGVAECGTCRQLYSGPHVCPGPVSEEDAHDPPSE